MKPPHGLAAPSAWVMRFARLFPPGGTVLDVACGSGRHVRALAALGLRVTCVDRDAAALEGLSDVARTVVADIESGPWPFAGQAFDAVILTNYLWRPLWPACIDAVAPGGWFIHETFALGHETIGRPSNPAFLLRPGELLQAVQGQLRVVAYEDGFLGEPDRFVQRIAACREPEGTAPVRRPLQAASGEVPGRSGE